MLNQFNLHSTSLSVLESKKLLVSTLNAHSFNLSQRNIAFKDALQNSDVLLPDGISIVWAKRFLDSKRLKKIAGADLFNWEMERLNKIGGTCYFLGSTDTTLNAIQMRAIKEFPNVKIYTHSPPFKEEFTEADNEAIIKLINEVIPDVLFIGMTAPKQEIWAYQNKDKLLCGHICCIGAVFDFYAGTVKRAPNWMIEIGLEWLYRLFREPRRLWKRYLIGNTKFIYYILKEKFSS